MTGTPTARQRERKARDRVFDYAEDYGIAHYLGRPELIDRRTAQLDRVLRAYARAIRATARGTQR